MVFNNKKTFYFFSLFEASPESGVQNFIHLHESSCRMGKIKEQTIQGTIFSYLGVLLGFLISGLFMPRFFSTAQNGLINLLIAWSGLFAQFATLGFGNATGRLFSWFRDEKTNHHGFSALTLIVGLAGFALAWIVLIVFRENIIRTKDGGISILADYFFFLIPLIFFTSFYLLFDVYFKMLYRTVVGTFLKEFLLRIFILLALLLFYIGWIDFKGFVVAYVIANCLPAFIMFAMLIFQRQISLKPDWHFISREMARALVSMSFFGVIVGFSNVLVLSADRIMVEKLIGIDAAGIYSITFFFGTLVVIPARSLRKIAGTMLAEAWKNKDNRTIEDIYAKSIVNQLLIGTLIFIGLWSNIHNVFEILPKEYESGKWVIFFVALAGLVEMSSGVSEILVQTSAYYRFSAVLNGLFLIFVIGFNYLFISIFGLMGAALANVVAYLLTNSIRYGFLYRKLGLRPFRPTHLLVLLSGLVVYFLAELLPPLKPFILDIFIRSSTITLIFILLAYKLRLSEDVNQTIDGLLLQIQKHFQKPKPLE